VCSTGLVVGGASRPYQGWSTSKAISAIEMMSLGLSKAAKQCFIC
jgi:hypothetical protein